MSVSQRRSLRVSLVAAVREPRPGVVGTDEVDPTADGDGQRVARPGVEVLEDGPELAPAELAGVQVRRVRWQEQEPCSAASTRARILLALCAPTLSRTTMSLGRSLWARTCSTNSSNKSRRGVLLARSLAAPRMASSATP